MIQPALAARSTRFSNILICGVIMLARLRKSILLLAIVALTSSDCGLHNSWTRTNWQKVPRQAGNLDFESETDWFLSRVTPKSYFEGIDRSQARSGTACGYLQSTSAQFKDLGVLMQQIQATDYLGERIRFSAFVRSEAVEQWAGLWMRVDGASKTYWFDNMRDRPIVGTRPWEEFAIVLDVPPDSRGISFGVLIEGRGTLWIDDVKLTTVSRDIRVTGEQRSD